MPEIKLFIATSIDGFIARENGALDWLDEIGSEIQEPTDMEKDTAHPDQPDGGYGKFMAGIDVLFMGRKTYDEVLGFGVEWPYVDCTTYVVTSDANYKVSTKDTYTINKLDKQVIDEIKSTSKKGIWVVGGGQLITQFLNFDEIDEMTLNLASIILGKGIRLFPNDPKETKFELVNTETFGSAMVNLTYRKK